MLNPIYNLPAIHFVGGESQVFLFHLQNPAGYDFDASGCSVGFAVINYANKNGAPILTKNADLIIGEDGVANIAKVELSPQDTANFYGRYIYQLTIVSGKTMDIPGQGIMDVARNIHTGYIRQTLGSRD